MSNAMCIVLAAGKGTRMRSAHAKVMHKIAHRTLLRHVLNTAELLAPQHIAVVIGPEMPDVAQEAGGHSVVIQQHRLGTGHAVQVALAAMPARTGPIIVIYGDTPLVRSETLAKLAASVGAAPAAAVAVLGVAVPPESGFGRFLFNDSGALEGIVEMADASEHQRALPIGNAGMMAIDGTRAESLLSALRNNNAQGEYYLTDIVGLAVERGWGACVVEAEPSEALGVNSRAELAVAEAQLQARLRAQAMAAGVTLQAPETVWLSADTQLAPDVVIGPNVVFGPGVSVESGVEILPFCHIEGAHIAAHARIGPFSRIRPGSQIGQDAHVGNFVELKNATLAEGVKVGHLSYLGDASLGARTNVGAGTITCNYDGYLKHRTQIGADVFIGSDTALVAPVTVGDRAVIGAGSVVVRDAPADALVLARGEQTILAEKGRSYHQRKAAAKAALSKPGKAD